MFSESPGNFVVVDESGKKEALESGSKVGCIVSQVLFYDQLRALKKSAEWCALVNNFYLHILLYILSSYSRGIHMISNTSFLNDVLCIGLRFLKMI